MGFNHVYLPKLEVLKEEFERKGLQTFVVDYSKYYGFTGPSESVEFLEEKAKQFYEQDDEVTNDINNNTNIDKL